MTVHAVGRRRLSAIQGERGTPSVSTPDASVVPAQRLLKVATALSEGAEKLHAQLRHLEPDERDAILDLVAEQVTEIVTLWADLGERRRLHRRRVGPDNPGAPEATERTARHPSRRTVRVGEPGTIPPA